MKLLEKILENAIIFNGSHSEVGNMCDYRCMSDCRSRGPELDPVPAPYFRGDFS